MTLQNWLRSTRLTLEEAVQRLKESESRKGRRLELMTLENRVVFSATPLPVDLTLPIDDIAFGAATEPASEPSLAEPDAAVATLHDTETAAESVAVLSEEPSQEAVDDLTVSRHELVIIDSAAGDYEQFIEDLLAGETTSRRVDFVVLDSEVDGVDQISELLAEYDELDAVHLLSHGAESYIQLGNSRLDADSLAGYAGRLSGWRDALSDDADLLIYGCDVAGTEDGRLLVEAIGELTGADVTASTNKTGHASLGGDWDLEYESGVIDTTNPFSLDAREHWFHLLDVAGYQEGTGGYAGTQDAQLNEGSPSSPDGGGTTITVDTDNGGGESEALIRFDNVFGGGAGQIPLGSTINSATLTVHVTNSTSSGAAIALHRMLINWDESSTWDSLTGGITPDDIEASSTPDATLANPNQTGSVTFNGLEATLQAWSDGGANYGWAILTDSANGWHFTSSEASVISQRPQLTVNYTPQSPVITSNGGGDTASANTAENTTAVTTVTATDPQSDPITFSISGGADAALFNINSTTGELVFIAAPDFENPTDADADNVYEVTVHVSDGVYADTQAISVTVTNVAEVTANDDIGSTNEENVLNVAAGGVLGNDIGGGGPVTAGETLNYDAANDGDATWNDDNATADFDWNINNFGTQVTYTTTPTTALPGITAAYQFSGTSSGASTTYFEGLPGDPTGGSASFELWFRPSALGGQQMLFETGANVDGTSIYLDGNNLVFATRDNGATPDQVSVDLVALIGDPTTEFIQMIGVIDRPGNQIELFVNGVSQGTSTLNGVDWGGTGNSGLGQATGNAAAGSGNLNGDIAIFRFYESALTAAQVDDNYQAIAGNALTVSEVEGSAANVGNQITLGSGALLTVNSDGSYSYNPDGKFEYLGAGDSTTESFMYTASNGTSSGSATVTITIEGVNDEEVLATNTGLVVNEGSAGNLITSTVLQATDVDNTAAQLTYTITGAVGNGTLRLSGTALGVNDTFTQADINAGLVTYDHDGSETVSDAFGFTVDDGLGSSTSGTFNITVAPINDAPVLDNSGATTLTQIDESDVDNPGDSVAAIIASAGDPITDADAGAVEGIAITSVDNSNGTWEYSTNGGASWTAVGNASDTSALLLSDAGTNRIRFVPLANFNGHAQFSYRAWDQTDGNPSGTAGVDVSANGGATAYSSAVETAEISVQPLQMIMLLTTEGDVTGSGAPGLDSWNNDQLLAFGDPDASFEPGTTDGTFFAYFDLSTFALNGSPQVDGIHYVSRNVTVGGATAPSIDLLVGDLILSINDNNETFTGSDALSINVSKKDVFVFRPDTPGDYSSGTFLILLDNIGTNFVTGVSLVELDTLVGDQLLRAGTFLLNVGNSQDILHFTADDVGLGSTSGSVSTLIAGSDIGLGSGSVKISGLDLIESDLNIGGTNLAAGNILVTLDGSDADVGLNNISVTAQDVFYLDITRTTMASGTTEANAYVFLEGADVGLDTTAEAIASLSLTNEYGSGNENPDISLPGSGASYTENDFPVRIDPTATATDVDSVDFFNGHLRVDLDGTGTVNDRLAIRHEGNGAGQVGVSGNNVTYAGITVGSYSGGDSSSSPLVITFNSNATSAVVQAVMRNVTFANVSEDPDISPRTVGFVLTDGDGGTSNIATTTVSVARRNDAPALGNGALTAAAEDEINSPGETVATIFSGQFSDPDTGASFSGIAVVGNTANSLTEGSWQYSTNGGLNWYDIGTVGDDATALVLDTATRIRFVPVADYYGAPTSLVVRGLDETYGGGFSSTDGSEIRVNVDASVNGGTTPIAGATAELSTAITAVNDEQVLATNTGMTVNEGSGGSVITTLMLETTDVDNTPGQLVYSVSAAPGNGILRLSGTALGVSDTFTQADLDAGLITYDHDGSETVSDSFSFDVDDGAGSVSSGSFGVAVTPVNDLPQATANTVTTSEGIAYTFTVGDFTYSDVEGDSLVSVTITNQSLAGGTLELSGVAVNSGDTITAAQIANLVYTPAANANGTPLATFDFTVNDAGLGTMSAQMDIDVTPVNDVPVATANTVTTNEDTAYTFSVGDFTFSDVEGDALVSVTITDQSLGGGTLQVNGVAVSNGDTITAAQIATLVYIPAANADGASLATFDFTVNDAGLGAVAAQMDIDVTPVNDVPVATAKTVTTSEDTAYSFAVGDFTFTDVESDALVSVTITNQSLAGGTLELSGVAVSNGDTITVAQIANLIYAPAANANEAPLATFDFTVNDAGLGTVSAQMDIDVTPVNDVPVATANTVATNEDTAYTFSVGDFTFSDVEGDSLVSVTITNQSLGGGTLELSGVVVTNGDTITAAQIANLVYTPPASLNGTSLATFDFTVNDAGVGTVRAQMDIDVTPVNDVPAAIANKVTTSEDTAYTFASSDFTYTDTEDDSLVSVTITNQNLAGGTLELSGVAVTNGDTIAAAQIANLVYKPAANANGAPLATFDFTVNDAGLGIVSAQMEIDVTPVNDVPVATANTVTTTEGTAYTFSAGDFTFSDVEADALVAVTITNQSLGGGTLELSGVAVANGDTITAAQIGNLVYTPAANANGAPLATFDFTVNDAGLGTVTAQMDIDVTDVNNVPVANANTVTTNEDTAYTFSPHDFTFSDVEGDALVSVTITNQSLGGGTLELRGVAVNNGDTITAAQIANLVYAPAANANGAPLATFDFTVNDAGLGTFSAQMEIDVTPVNDAPIAADDEFLAKAGTHFSGDVSLNDRDVDGNTLSYTLISGTANGTIVLNGDGSFAYTPDTAFNGPDSFTYLVVDGVGGSATGAAVITVERALPSVAERELLGDSDLPDPSNDIGPENLMDEEEQQEKSVDSATADLPDRSLPTERVLGTGSSRNAEKILEPAVTGGAQRSAQIVDDQLTQETVDGARREPAESVTLDTWYVSDFLHTLQVHSSSVQFNPAAVNWKQLMDSLQWIQQDHGERAHLQFVVGTAAIVTSAASVCYVLWSIRGASLIASMFSSLPLWVLIDPLPIIDSAGKTGPFAPTSGDGEKADETLEEIVKRGKQSQGNALV